MESWCKVQGYIRHLAPGRCGSRGGGNEITLNKRGGERSGRTLTCARGRLPVISLETGESSWLPYLVREPFSRCFVSSSLWHCLWRLSLSLPSSPSPGPIPSSSVRAREPVLCPSFSPAKLQVSADLVPSLFPPSLSSSHPRSRFCARSRWVRAARREWRPEGGGRPGGGRGGSCSGQKRKRARSGDNDDDDDGVVARGPRNADTSRLIRSRVASSPLVVLRPESLVRKATLWNASSVYSCSRTCREKSRRSSHRERWFVRELNAREREREKYIVIWLH